MADNQNSSPPSAVAATAKRHAGGWVYEVVGKWHDSDSIPPHAIRGAWKVGEDGRIVGGFKPNPRFRDPRS